jgi:hypothetical protein
MRRISRFAVVLAGAVFVLVPTAAQADPSFYESPIFGVTTVACSTLVSGKPILTSIAYRGAALWGATWSLVPGLADVTPLTP